MALDGCSYYLHCVTPVTLNKIRQPQGVDYKVYWLQGLPHPLSKNSPASQCPLSL